ncbi:Os02g0707500, partial [Oryza sativa Japonica Group]
FNGSRGGFEEVKEVETALLLPPVLSLLVERRMRYGGGKLEVSFGYSFVDRPRACTCERVACAGWHELGAGAHECDSGLARGNTGRHRRWLGLAE